MEKKKIADWVIEYDKQRTQEAILDLPDNFLCNCNICRNFYKASLNFPITVVGCFYSLGLDIAKPTEVYDIDFEDNLVRYFGFYHVVGQELTYLDKKFSKVVETFKISEGFEISLTNQISFKPKNFPKPVLQIDIDFYVP
ncbi:hypothetical protein RyT2_15290 [Pseudolactococcus yaeyamensis]